MMKIPSFKYGLLGGVVVMFYFLILYVIKTEHFFSPFLQWGSMFFYLFFMYKAAQEDCAAHGIDRDFRELLRSPFVVFLLINLVYWLFYYGLHLYDGGLVLAELDMERKSLQSQLTAGLGDPEQSNLFRERIAALDSLMLNPSTQPLGPIITRMCIGSIGGFILAAGIAGIFKMKK